MIGMRRVAAVVAATGLAWTVAPAEVMGAAPADVTYVFVGSGSTEPFVCTSDGCLGGQADSGSLSSCAGACEVAGDSVSYRLAPTDPYAPSDPYKCRVHDLAGDATVVWADASVSTIALRAKPPPNSVRVFKASGLVTGGRYAGRKVAIVVERSSAP